MGKANISFPDGLLEEIDRRAAAGGTTRSGFVQEAAASYIARLDDDRVRAERERGIGDAMRRMRDLAHRLELKDGGDAVRAVRDARPRSERRGG